MGFACRSLTDILGRTTSRCALGVFETGIKTRTLTTGRMNELHVTRIDDILVREGRRVALHHAIALGELSVTHHGECYLVLLLPFLHVGTGRRISLGILALNPQNFEAFVFIRFVKCLYVADVRFAGASPAGGEYHPYRLIDPAVRMKLVFGPFRILQLDVLDKVANILSGFLVVVITLCCRCGIFRWSSVGRSGSG